MTYSPEKNIKINSFIVLLILAVFGGVLAVCKLFDLPGIIWQSTFFVLAVITCEFMTKYFLPIYTYSYDSNSFIITKTMGKKTVTVCNIDTDRIVALYTKDEYKKQERYLPKSIYNYNGNVIAHSCYVLIFEYSSCCEAVVFEPNKNMAETILSSIENL